MSLGRAPLLVAVALFACNGETGPAGPPGEAQTGEPGTAGEPGEPGAPNLSRIEPPRVYLGREAVPVMISGAGTDWMSASDLTLDFGPGIEVDTASVNVLSTTSLLCTVAVTTAAPIGLRTIRVCNAKAPEGEACPQYAGVFAVVDALAVTPKSGATFNTKQGSVVQAGVVGIDPASPFDGFPEHVAVHLVPNDATLVGDDSVFHPLVLSPYDLDLFLELDVFTPPGVYGVVVDSGPPGAEIRSASSPKLFEIAARDPFPLAIGPNPAALASPDASLLYEIDLPSEKLLTIEISAPDPTAKADVVYLPTSGKFEQALVRASKFSADTIRVFALAPSGKSYLIYRGFGGASGYPLSIDLSPESLSTSTALGGPTTVAGQIDTGKAGWFSVSANAGDQIAFTVGAAPTSECGGAPMPVLPVVDSEIQLLDQSGSALAFNDDIAGNDWCSRVVHDVESSGTYYVRVSSSQRFDPDGAFDYTLSYEVQ